MPDTLSKRPQDVDWSALRGSMPLQGVVRPKGLAKAKLVARLDKAIRANKRRETA